MSPIPTLSSQAPPLSTLTITPGLTPVNVTPTSLTHLSAVAAFFLVLLLVLVTGLLGYVLYKCLAPEDTKPNPPLFRPLVLSKRVSMDGTASVVQHTAAICHLPYEKLTAYTINENGVKKGIRLYPSSVISSFLQDVKPTPESPSHTSQPSAATHSTPSLSPDLSALSLSKPPPVRVRGGVDLYANPKLFPVQGPIKRMETFHATSPAKPVEIASPPAVYSFPLSPRKSSATTHLATLPSNPPNTPDVADLPFKTSILPTKYQAKHPVPQAAADIRPETKFSPQDPYKLAVPSTTCPIPLRCLTTQDLADLRTKPRVFPVQARCAQGGTPVNALTALALTTTTERLLADLKNNSKLAPVAGPIRPLETRPPRYRHDPRYKSVTAAHKTHIIHRGKENLPMPRSAMAYF